MKRLKWTKLPEQQRGKLFYALSSVSIDDATLNKLHIWPDTIHAAMDVLRDALKPKKPKPRKGKRGRK